MPQRDLPQPTNAELEILRVLWQRGPSTVREVQDTLKRDPPVRYTTTLKLLQIMADKGLVTRDESTRTHVYAAAVSQKATQRRLVRDLLDRAFDGSATGLVLQALSTETATPEELNRIRMLIDQLGQEDR